MPWNDEIILEKMDNCGHGREYELEVERLHKLRP